MEFEGDYFCSEVDAKYQVFAEDQRLVLSNLKYGNAELIPVDIDQFSTTHWWMTNILFARNDEGKVIGFDVNSERVLNLRFDTN